MHGPTAPYTTITEIQAPEAARLADRLLACVGTRLAHSEGVAGQVARVARLFDAPWRSAITDAAWLHDIGYSDQVTHTGFHPLDGARWLRDHGWPPQVCRLVAWHTDAVFEAAIRGLVRDLTKEFDPPPQSVAAALSWADMTTSPTGEQCSISHRIDDILERHSAGSAVRVATAAAHPALCTAAAEVEALLAFDAASA